MSSPSPRLIFLSFRMMGWLFPPPPLDEQAAGSPEVLAERSKRFNRLSGIVCLFLFLACTTAFCIVSCIAAEDHLARLGQPLFLIRAEPFELCVWSVFLAAVVTPPLGLLALRVVLGKQRYDECLAAASHSAMGGEQGVKVHLGKMFAFLLLLLGPLLVGLIVLRIDTYTAFTDDAMVINPFWSRGEEEVRPYRDVRGVYAVAGYHARFRDVERPCHALVFADGTVWTTGDDLHARWESDRLFIQHAAQRSGRPVQPIRFLEDVPR